MFIDGLSKQELLGLRVVRLCSSSEVAYASFIVSTRSVTDSTGKIVVPAFRETYHHRSRKIQDKQTMQRLRQARQIRDHQDPRAQVIPHYRDNRGEADSITVDIC